MRTLGVTAVIVKSRTTGSAVKRPLRNVRISLDRFMAIAGHAPVSFESRHDMGRLAAAGDGHRPFDAAFLAQLES